MSTHKGGGLRDDSRFHTITDTRKKEGQTRQKPGDILNERSFDAKIKASHFTD